MARNFITGTISVPAGCVFFAVFRDATRFALFGGAVRRARVFLGFDAASCSAVSTRAISD
jgi:hypothetical protein